jgi:hypothetical protein
MLSLQRKQSEVQPSAKETKLRWNVLFKDLSFFGSLSLAHLIVWRVLRRRRKERAVRLKRITLVEDTTMKRMNV